MRSLSLLLAGLWLALPGRVQAADGDAFARGIDPISSKLGTSIDGFLTIEGGRVAPPGSYQLQLGLDFASGLMALKAGDEKIGDLVETRFDLHLMGAYSLTRWAEVGIDVPFTAWQATGFDALTERTGYADSPPSSSGIGDVRLVGKIRLLDEAQAPASVAVLAEVRLPTGDDKSFLSERGFFLSPRAVVERTFMGNIRLALEGGYRYRSDAGQFPGVYVGDELTLGLAGAYQMPESLLRKWSIFGELLAATQVRGPMNVSSDALHSPLEALIGTRAMFAKNLHASLAVGRGVTLQSGYGREDFRALVTVRWERLWNDRDGDGIPDDDDQCPDDPEDRDGYQDSDGCPDPDNDGDGIPDAQDKCPDKPGPKEFQGCPDTDKDGIPDGVDRCPEKAGPPEYDGCPDTDGDEVPDQDDKCPEVFGDPKLDGCPPQGPLVSLESGKLIVKGTINFDTGKASIKKDSWPLLDEAATILKDHPELKKLRIEGHTDNIGGANYNRDLSKRRAHAVVEYLITKGVAAQRLEFEGYGLEKPVAPNTSALGRAKNRRVEFTVVE